MATQPSAAAVRPAPLTDETFSYINWSAIIAGALVAAAVAFVLHSFGVAIGLGISSSAPTWRDASLALVALSGVYLVLVALLAYSVGGYVAGRMRTRLSDGTPDEVEFRDGVHGAATWALATLLTALLVFGAAQSLTRLDQLRRRRQSAARASSPLTSTVYFAAFARTSTWNKPVRRRGAFCSPPPVTGVCCPRIAPNLCAW
jgi:hypothetical protein